MCVHTHTHHAISLTARVPRDRMAQCCWKSSPLSEDKATCYSCLSSCSRWLLIFLLLSFLFFLVVALHEIWVGPFPVTPQLATRTQSGGLCGPGTLKRVSEELPARESVHFFTFIKRWQKLLLMPAATMTSHPSSLQTPYPIRRLKWEGRVRESLGMLGRWEMGVVPIKTRWSLGRRVFPRKSLINIGHVCKRKTSVLTT